MQDAVVVSQPISFANRLLATYKELDEHMRRALKRPPETSHMRLLETMAKSNPLFERALYDLQTFARLRNAIVHTELPDGSPIAEPHEAGVIEYETTVAGLLNPPSALSVAIPSHRIFTTEWTRRVRDVIAVMNEKVYTHVPVLCNMGLHPGPSRRCAGATPRFGNRPPNIGN